MAVTHPRSPTAHPAPSPAFSRIHGVKWWAGLGAAFLLAEAYILIHWISSDYFHHVGSGPDPVPGWMKVALVGWQIILPIAGLAVIIWFVVRPWRRERRLGVEGLLVVAFSTLWVVDPMSAYGGEWF